MEWMEPVLGGVLIGMAAAVLFLLNGRVAGISGIASGFVQPWNGDSGWRIWFVGGLALGGVLAVRMAPEAFAPGVERSVPALLAAGLLVGFGTRMANGCTSGHGVCGVARLSRRSIVATGTFMAVGALVAFSVRAFLGGAV